MNSRWFAPISIGLMLAAGLIAWPHLPDEVAIHWNFQGQVDGYSPRWMAVLLMPVLALMVSALFRFAIRHNPASSRALNAGIMARYKNAIVMFLFVMQLALLGNAAGLPNFNFVRIALIGTGALLALIGNEMGRLKPNSWAGIRTSWAMADEDVWRESNRMGGRSMFITGVLIVLLAVLLPSDVAILAVLTCALGWIVFMLSYSYRLAQKRRST
jgi:uncharacterized membrane protein